MLAETFTFDSSTQGSDLAHQEHNEANKITILHYKAKTRVIRNFTYFLSFILLLFAILNPWLSVRSSAIRSIDGVLQSHLRIISGSIESTINSVGSEYETSMRFLNGLMHDPKVILCDKIHISYLLKVLRSMYDAITLPPSQFFVIDTKQNMCTISWKEEILYFQSNALQNVEKYNISTFYKMFPKKFSLDDMYLSFNEVENESIPFRNITESFGDPLKHDLATWTHFYSQELQDPELSVYIPYHLLNDKFVVSGMTLSVDQVLQEIINNEEKSGQYRFALVDSNDGVVFESKIGIQKPQFQDNVTLFPELKDINHFWAEVAKGTIGTEYEQIKNVIVYDHSYHVVKSYIDIMDYTLYVALYYEQIVENAFYMSATYILLCIVVITILFLIYLSFYKYNHKWKLNKFESQYHAIENAQTGTITKAINKLRSLQLRFPDNSSFSSMLDVVVLNLSEQRNRHFSCSLNMSKCEFCSYLVPKKPKYVKDGSICYKKWSSPFTYQHLGTLEFPWEDHVKAPLGGIIRLMSTIIQTEKLLFHQFDPDSLIQFMYLFASQCCKDNVRTAHSIHSLNFLMNNKFNHWLNNKIDHLILYIAAFVANTDCTIIYDNLDDSFSQSTEQMYSSDFSDSSSPDEAVLDLKKHFTAFSDDESIITRNIQLILSLLSEFVPETETKDDLRNYFNQTLTDVLYSIQDKKQFELLGEFNIRVSSKDFFANDDISDRILFIKFLIKFCDYCMYWADVDIMIKSTERMSQSIFTQQDDPSFIAKFHYAHASKIVAPWISVVCQMLQDYTIRENFERNLQYLEAQANVHPL